MTPSRSLPLLFALASAACSSTDEQATAPIDESNYTFDITGELTTFKAQVAVTDVPPGYEDTKCITVRLDNPEPALVRRFRGTLTDGSHHMIVYRSDETEEQLEPQRCWGFSGLLGGEHPIFIAQQRDAVLTLPTDDGVAVGLEIAPYQMLKLELHHINTGAAPADVVGDLYLDTTPLADEIIRSDLAFWGTTNLNGAGDPPSASIPPGARGDTGLMFQRGISGTKTFAATTHQHHLGTRMRIWHAHRDELDDLGEPVADSSSWSDPPLELYDPPLTFPDEGGTFSEQVLAYRCEWQNTTTSAVSWGDGFDDEMCFLWQYYYPSHGFQVCLNNLCLFDDDIDF